MNGKSIRVIFLISMIYSTAYALTLSKGVFYDEMLRGFSMSNLQFGRMFSVLGIFSMLAYLCAAWFSTRFSSRLIVLTALLVNTAVPATLSTMPPYPVMLLCFAVMGFTNGIFFPVSVELVRNAVSLNLQGHAFGVNYIFISLTGSAVTLICYAVLPFFPSPAGRVRVLLILFAILNAVSLILAFFHLEEAKPGAQLQHENLPATLSSLLRNPTVWAVVLIVFINYIGYCTLNYTQPYLSDVVHLPALVANLVTLLRMYFIVILAAPLAGMITDMYRASVVLIRATFLAFFLAAFAIVFIHGLSPFFLVILILVLCMTANMAKSMALITISEIGLSPYAISVGISLVSFLGFSPDAFYYSLCGWLLDSFGDAGYTYIFALAGTLTVIGFFICHWLRRQGVKRSFG